MRPAARALAGLAGALVLLGASALGAGAAAIPAARGTAHDAAAGARSGRLTGIACWQVGRCLAVGTYVPPVTSGASGPGDTNLYGNPSKTLAEVSFGTRWRIVPSANVGLGGAQLFGVACASDGHCIAVGHDQPLSLAETAYQVPLYRPLVERYSGQSLQTLTVPAIGSSSALLGVSCPLGGRCFAVGYSVSGGRTEALIEAGSGNLWRVLPAASPLNATAQLTAISCPSSGVCVAVGSYSPDSDPSAQFPLVESLAGGAFTLDPLSVAQGTGAILYAIACSSASNCVAVGQATMDLSRTSAFVATFRTSTWTSAPGAVADADGSGALVTVSCPSGACLALGWEAQSTTLPEQTIVLRVLNAQVSVLAAPPSPMAVAAVGCVSSSTCTAVGAAGTTPYVGQFFAGTWTATAAPLP